MRTGRPTFRLDARRLREIREEKGLTQEELARRAYANPKSKKPPRDSEKARTRHYQRIERTGCTSSSMAEALAAELDTTVSVLQGGAPEVEELDRVNEIEQQLRAQLALGTNHALQAALEREKDAEDPVRELAQDVSGWIEAAQIGQQTEELAKLAKLTGWSVDELRRPMSRYGYWMLMSTENGYRTTEIVSGVVNVVNRVWENVSKQAERWRGSDMRVTLRKEKPWFHVVVEHPRFRKLRLVQSFVRCLPNSSGLQWVNPSWQDRWLLEEFSDLEKEAFSRTNFLVDFNGMQRPGELRKLRLMVRESDGKGGFSTLCVARSELVESLPHLLEHCIEDGNGHHLMMNWLSSALWNELLPHLSQWPLEYWEIRKFHGIQIFLNLPYRVAMERGELPQFGPKYGIRLVEEVTPGNFELAPWRESCMDSFIEGLQKRLDDARREAAASMVAL